MGMKLQQYGTSRKTTEHQQQRERETEIWPTGKLADGQRGDQNRLKFLMNWINLSFNN